MTEWCLVNRLTSLAFDWFNGNVRASGTNWRETLANGFWAEWLEGTQTIAISIGSLVDSGRLLGRRSSLPVRCQ